MACVLEADDKETGMRIPYRQQLGIAMLGFEAAIVAVSIGCC
jgi:hypothetical protein